MRQIGRVKWFNNKAGYGFITLTGETEKDVFVHHSSIQVGNEQYKYLVQGEYVEFNLETSSGAHEYQAGEVRGIQGGKLMCETRRENKTNGSPPPPPKEEGEWKLAKEKKARAV